MKMDCLLAGVGGQGTVLASRLIAQTAMEALGLAAHTSETIGMAQRGGSVTSQVRIGEGACAPAIPLGGAEFILGFEPAEALRNFPYLKEGGTVLVVSHLHTERDRFDLMIALADGGAVTSRAGACR